MVPTIETVDYNVVTGNYNEFIEVLRRVLAEYEPPNEREHVMDIYHQPHPVLARQLHPHQPARWICINLHGEDNQRTTLAIRDDNVYLIGFKNQEGRWYEFGFSRRSTRLLPAEWSSTFLECDVTYRSMVGGVVANNLVQVGLGKWFARDAVRRLSVYQQAPGGQADDRTKRHLARLVVMICESARMIPHYETVRDGWDSSTGAINEQQVQYLWNWKRMSHAVLLWNRWREDGMRLQPPAWPWELLYADIRNVGQALQVVQLLLNWPDQRASPSSQPREGTMLYAAADDDNGAEDISRHHQHWHGAAVAYGQSLVEVFVVHAGFHVRGAISVFDGVRGQIVYKPDLGETADVFDSDAHGHFAKRMFAQLRTIYNNWPPFGWKRRRRTITGERENDTMASAPVRNFLQGHHDLLLTGPYRAISAYGRVSIEVDTSTTDSNGVGISTTDSYFEAGVSRTDYIKIDISKTDGDSSNGGTTLLWDCYNDAKDAAYDRLMTRTISTGHGPFEVTYAVLSNAVEATVQVKLLMDAPAANALIHGRITARGWGFDARSVLFSRDPDEKVPVLHDSAVPLARSVVAVALGSPLVVEASLHASVASSNQAGVDAIIVEARFYPEPYGEQLQQLHTEHGEVEMKITWGRSAKNPHPLGPQISNVNELTSMKMSYIEY